jgi:RND family efflux transporter MFP subunit
MVTQNDILYRVVDISSLIISVGVSQEMVSFIKPDTEAKIEISSLSNEIFPGHIKYISPQASENTGTFTVEIYVNNSKDRKIKAGMTARVEITVNRQADQTVVPDHAIMTRGDSSFVYLISGRNAILTPIIIRNNFDTLYSIDSGISPGDTIVVVGLKNLYDEAPVWIEKLN